MIDVDPSVSVDEHDSDAFMRPAHTEHSIARCKRLSTSTVREDRRLSRRQTIRAEQQDCTRISNSRVAVELVWTPYPVSPFDLPRRMNRRAVLEREPTQDDPTGSALQG
ncbi:MAG: hypothetical protein ACI835_004579 [Planctomycetota bacterium]|jgi:hypothetical protein